MAVQKMHRALEPLLFRSRRLEAGTAELVYEALKRGLPFDLRQMADLIQDVGPDCELEAFWVMLGCDRAATNYVVAEWNFEDIIMSGDAAIPHVEFCKGHGCILAKNRAHAAKELRTCLSSLTKWLKHSTNLEALDKGIRATVQLSDFDWEMGPRPAEEIQAAEDLKHSLFINTDTLSRPAVQPDGSVRWVDEFP